MIHYFAYGSNMDEGDFEKWCKDKERDMVKLQNPRAAKLNGYKLTFNYYSTCRGAGAANIMEDKERCVYGILIEIEDSDLETIRRKEGYHSGHYHEICIDVEQLSDGRVFHGVKTYKVTKDEEKPDHRCPTKYYLQLIIKNAKRYNFPKEYIECLESIPAKK